MKSYRVYAVVPVACAMIACGGQNTSKATPAADTELVPPVKANTAVARARPSAAVTVVAPAEASVPDGAPRKVTLSNGRAVMLSPFKVDAKSGLSHGRCGVRIEGVMLETLGSGDTDAYTCGKLVDAGALPPAGGKRRIGLIYDTSSPNASFRTAVILVQGSRGGWTVDAGTLGQYDDTPAARSIAALSKAVR